MLVLLSRSIEGLVQLIHFVPLGEGFLQRSVLRVAYSNHCQNEGEESDEDGEEEHKDLQVSEHSEYHGHDVGQVVKHPQEEERLDNLHEEDQSHKDLVDDVERRHGVLQDRISN